jgi:hypothetical protein
MPRICASQKNRPRLLGLIRNRPGDFLLHLVGVSAVKIIGS